MRIVGRELRQINLRQAGVPRGEIRSHVYQVLESRQRLIALAEFELRSTGDIEQGEVPGKFLQRLRRAVQCLSGLADAQLEPRQRYGDCGIGGDGLHAFQQYSFGCGGAAGFRFEFGKCDVGLGAFGICIEDVLEVAAGFIRSACRKSQLRERIVRAYIAMPDFAGSQQRLPPLLQLALVQLDGGGQDLADRLGGLGLFQPLGGRERPGIVLGLHKGNKQRDFRQRRGGVDGDDPLQIPDRSPGVSRGNLRDAELRSQHPIIGLVF